MNNRQWIQVSLAATGAAILVAAASLMLLDSYGLFRPVKDRSLPIYYADRMGKSLLNFRYVPSNFNALLIGPSSSVNWEPDVISAGTGMRMYNESLEGGDASEERLLVDKAMVRGRFELAMVLLYPTMISSHEIHDGMDKARWTEALGSLDAYVQTALSELSLHHHIVTNKQYATGDGSHEMRNAKGEFTKAKFLVTEDPTAMRDLKQITTNLQQHGVRIVYVVPSVYESVLQNNQAELKSFLDSMKAQLPRAPVINLNAPEYASIRSNTDNYIDSYHVTPAGARLFSEILNERLRAVLEQNQNH